MDELVQILQQLIAHVEQNRNQLSDAAKVRAAQTIQQLVQQIEQQQAAPAVQPGIPQGADLLWILSGENPQAFTNYLRQVPDPILNNLSQNPQHLQSVIEELSRRITPPAGESAQGIPKASLQSSNIYGFQYDPRSGRLLVKFQGNDGNGAGPIYQYEGVQPQIFKVFQQGAIPAHTSGENQWGSWWVGKQPSLGASFYQLIREGGYPYQKVA